MQMKILQPESMNMYKMNQLLEMNTVGLSVQMHHFPPKRTITS